MHPTYQAKYTLYSTPTSGSVEVYTCIHFQFFSYTLLPLLKLHLHTCTLLSQPHSVGIAWRCRSMGVCTLVLIAILQCTVTKVYVMSIESRILCDLASWSPYPYRFFGFALLDFCNQFSFFSSTASGSFCPFMPSNGRLRFK